MAVRLNKSAFEHAQELINAGRVVFDQRPAWSEHQPSAEKQDEFIRLHRLDEYAKWHLGVDDTIHQHTKACYQLPYGDFENVHRCAVTIAESVAGQHKRISGPPPAVLCEEVDYHGIESAAAHLHGMIDAVKR
jgi:hypothetical protein